MRLKAFPVQIIKVENGVILKRGCVEVKIGGEGAAEVIRLVMEAVSGDGATRQEICEPFALPDRPFVEQLIDQLIARRLLVACNEACRTSSESEDGSDIFYWHFGESAAEVINRLNKRRILIFGVNSISSRMVSALAESGVYSFQVVDLPLLRNLRFFDESGKLKAHAWPACSIPPHEWTDGTSSESLDCLVVTSDFGGRQALREWNKFSIERKCHFLPVVLKNLIGYVGPLVIPGQTACFECLLSRQNAHLDDPGVHLVVEGSAFAGQGIVGFHPSMASILGEIAAFELIKFYSEVISSPKVGTLIEVNLLATRLTARKVLKVPRCSVCSPLIKRPSITPKMTMFSPAKRAVE